MKSGSPSQMTAAHKTQTKIQAWSSLVFHCRHSSFNPSEAPPWDSRPVSGTGVVHYHLLHRPRSVPTALGPAPLATYPHRPSQAAGYPRDCALLPPPPSPGGVRQDGRGVPGGKDRRGERKGDRRMRSDSEERGEREKKKSLSGSRTHCCLVLNQLSGSLAVPCDGTGPLWWTARCSSASWRTAMAPPVECSRQRVPRGTGVVHYHLLHRPRSVPTALGPAPLATNVFWGCLFAKGTGKLHRIKGTMDRAVYHQGQGIKAS